MLPAAAAASGPYRYHPATAGSVGELHLTVGFDTDPGHGHVDADRVDAEPGGLDAGHSGRGRQLRRRDGDLDQGVWRASGSDGAGAEEEAVGSASIPPHLPACTPQGTPPGTPRAPCR